MALIAARAPYYIEQNTDNLAIELRIYYDGDSVPTNPQYTIVKTSFEDGVPEDLKINISPYLYDFFVMVPLTGTLTDTAQPPNTEFIHVEVNVNGTPEDHTALNGYLAPTTIQHYDTWQTVKSIEPDTDSMVTLDASATKVDYILSDGSITTLTFGSTDRSHVAPVKFVDLSNTSTLQMKVYYPAGIINYNFNVDCPYQASTIGFVDQYGFWQYFDSVHKQDFTYTRDSNTFTSAADHNKKMFNANGSHTHVFRTGWVDDNFRRVVGALMVSEHIVLHFGSIVENIILTDKNKPRLFSRNGELMMYEFRFDSAVNIIPTI